MERPAAARGSDGRAVDTLRYWEVLLLPRLLRPPSRGRWGAEDDEWRLSGPSLTAEEDDDEEEEE